MAFCDNCGHELRSTSKFCGSCGTPTESIDDTPKTRRSKPVQSRKKSREKELAEYEDEYLSRSKSSSKQDSDYDAARRRRGMERPGGWKSESITLLLAILPGLLVILGLGHLYLGASRRGIGFLIVGLVMLIVGLPAVLSNHPGTILVGTVILISTIPLFIWQIIDSRKLCRQYNDYYEEYGKAPNW